MLSYEEIASAISAELSSVLLENEAIIDDLEAYAQTISTFGWRYEANFGFTWRGNRAGAQCFAGELGEAALQYMLQSVPAEMRELAEECAREMSGHIYYYIDAMAEAIQAIAVEHDLADEEIIRRVRRMVVFTVAHERRHSYQPASLLDVQVNNLDDIEAYQRQPHEADADAFGRAVVRGQASLSDVATWRPAA